MKTSSASSTLPFVPAPSTPSPASSSDTKTSFAEVLHQQGGDKTDNSNSKSTDQNSTQNSSDSNTTSSPDTHSTKETDKTSGTNTTTNAPKSKDSSKTSDPKDDTMVLKGNTDLASLIVQAAAQAPKTSAPAPVTTTPTTTDSTKDAPKTTSGELDLTTLIAQAAIATSQATAAATPAATTTTATNTPAAAQVASIAADTGTELPPSTGIKVPTTPIGKEKKSASNHSEGSFLQSGTATSTSISSQLAAMAGAAKPGTEDSLNQNLGDATDSKKSALGALGAAASNTAGTANDNKDSDMTTSLNIAGLAAGNRSNGINIPAADVHVHLTSNSDFNSALKHVMEVSTVGDTASMRTPLRVAMELQTPPGAVVNVYISKATDGTDGYRAQLSTNDPAALSWVQNKLGELRDSNDFGVNVKWLPAQTESTTTTVASTSSGNNDGLSWDRGGQNQQGQQQDERQSRQQQKGDLFPGMPSLNDLSFMNQFQSIGRAA